MSDEVYRPRPNANPQNQNFDKLDLPPNHPANLQGNAMPEGGVQITGNVPEALLRRMQERKANMQHQQPPEQHHVPENVPQAPFRPPIPPTDKRFNQNFADGHIPVTTKPTPATVFNNNGVPVVVSEETQALLDSLKSQSAIFEEITLPSLGRFYNGQDGPTDGKLHIRPMTGDEEQILATPRFLQKGLAVNMIFSRCIQEPFRPENLLSVDRTYLLIYLRGISYGHEYEVEIKDPETQRKFSTVIDLDSLPVEPCPLDFGPASLTDVLPDSGWTFTYRMSKGKDEQELQEYRDRKIKKSADSEADDTLLFRTAQLVESIAGITNKQEIKLLLKNLKIKDLSYIRSVVNDPPFGVDTNVTILSPMNNEEFEVSLPIDASFFFPRHKKKERNHLV